MYIIRIGCIAPLANLPTIDCKFTVPQKIKPIYLTTYLPITETKTLIKSKFKTEGISNLACCHLKLDEKKHVLMILILKTFYFHCCLTEAKHNTTHRANLTIVFCCAKFGPKTNCPRQKNVCHTSPPN